MKNIVLTGATSGIGLATAKLLAVEGHRLLLISRSQRKLEELQKELGANVSIGVCDVSNYENLELLANTIAGEWDEIDVLINNAGVGYFDKIADGKIAEWHSMVDTNVKGVLNAIHVFLPALLANHGHVVNIGSVASHQVFANSAIYSATKHAVFAISEGLRIELAGKIKVTTISPGAVNTPFIDNTSSVAMLEEYKAYFANALAPEIVAEQINYAINAPENSVITEIIVRPNRQTK